MKNEVVVSKKDSVLEVRLDRPEKRNALTQAMYRSLAEALEGAAEARDVRAVLLGGNGDVFCGGNDVADFLGGLGDGEPPVLRFLKALVGFPKPIVASVGGAAIGIGTTMLLHVDLVYASTTAYLQTPFASMGLVPEAASSLLLPQRVGHAVAAEMLMLGARVDAVRAKEVGLFNDVLPKNDLEAHARAKAEEVARWPGRAMRLTKSLVRTDREAVLARMGEEAKHFVECLASPEAREAFTAFLERRKPDFSKFE
jgi:enoyl-CoA hydratase/carnithine racemase